MLDGSDIRAAVVGLGVMGTGIARSLATAGVAICLYDSRENQAVRAKADIISALERRGHPAAQSAADLLNPVNSLSGVTKCDFVIEAIHEDLDEKRALLSALDKLLGPNVIIASNTSSLSLTELALALQRPQRFVGMHFFVPAHANPLVEVGQAPQTAERVVQSTIAFARWLDKEPLRCRDAPGFITNRFYLPLINEAMRIVDEGGLSAAEADAAAIEAFDLSIGPFSVCRMGKLSTTLAAVDGLSSLGKFYEPCKALVERGRAERHWPEEALQLGFAPPEEFVRRLRAAVFFAVLDALEGDVAEAAAFDKAAEIGLRFGRPPFALMEELGREYVERCVGEVARDYSASVPKSVTKINSLADVASD